MGFLDSLFRRRKASVPEKKRQAPQQNGHVEPAPPLEHPHDESQSPPPELNPVRSSPSSGEFNTYPPGSHIAGRYEVASRPLIGGMGIVYLCLDREEDDRPVALKTFKPEYLPDREARDRFLREGTTWMNLGRHPHIVHAYGVEHIGDGTEVFLVLEQVAREQGWEDASLRSWLTPGRPLPVEQALLIALQIVRGMRYAVEKLPGFVHRDLKPENVLVGADRLTQANINRVRVTDFGLVQVLEGDGLKAEEIPEVSEDDDSPRIIDNQPYKLGSRTQLTKGLVGTPLYMAPEQWRGEVVSTATDVYALGCILYEMLTGVHAASGRSLKELKEAHCGPILISWPESVPNELKALVERCLERGPRERFREWEELENLICVVFSQVLGTRAPLSEPEESLVSSECVALGWALNAIGAAYQDIGKADVAVNYFKQAYEVGQVEQARDLVGAALGNLGNADYSLGEVRKAIEYHEQALIISREIGNRLLEGINMGNLGLDYSHLGEVREAIEYHKRALAIRREIGDRLGEGSSLCNLGNAYHSLSELGNAIEYHDLALAVSRKIGDRRGEGSSLCNLGNAYYAFGEVRKATDYYEQALAINLEIGNRQGESKNLCNLGNVYYSFGELRKAIEYYEQALAINREIGNRRGEGDNLGNLGNAYYSLGEIRKAIGYNEQALVINLEIGNRRGEGDNLGNLGNAYYSLGEMRKAIVYYKQALAINREIGNRQGEGNNLCHIGNTHYSFGELRQAIEYYEQALAINREIGNRQGEGDNLGNLAKAYFSLGEMRQAIEHHEQDLSIRREIGDRSGEGNDLSNLGHAYSDLNEASRAIEYYEQALVIFQEIEDANGVATNLFNIALLYVQQNKSDRALLLAKEAERLFTEIKSPYTQNARNLIVQLEVGITDKT